MKRRLVLLTVLLLGAAIPTSTAPRLLVVRCGTLIADAAKPPIRNASVVITDGRISDIRTGLTPTPDAQLLDLTAYTVMPGLVDAHSHLWTGPLTSQTVSDALATVRASKAVAFALESGVVGMRTVGGQGFIDVALAAAIDEGTIPGPHIVPAAHAISTPGGHGDFIPMPPSFALEDYYTPLNGFVNSPADAEKAVHLQIKYGARVIKILASGGVASPLDSPTAEQISPEEMKVIVEQAHMAGLKVAAHAENLKTILDALHAGVDSIEHGSDLNQEAIDFMKAHHVLLVPTLNVVDSVVRMSDARFPEHMIRKGKALASKHFASFKRALEAGVTMAAGADDFYQPGRPTGLPSELVTDVKYGMTAQQALVTATANSAELTGLDMLGAIAVGKEGTLIAVEGDPLSDITAVQRVRAVVKAGQIVKEPAAQPAAPTTDPLVKENATIKVSDHVYFIPDFNVGLVPNVGIIVGNRATLVVDTGLGPRNGQTVIREMSKLSKNTDVYVVSTHFHPEHALGEAAFPATAHVIRARAQQQDIDEFDLTLAKQFATRSPLTADLLKDVAFRKADIFFDREYPLDLGGVRVRLMWLGPTHTRGDTVAWVEDDRVLFAGDIVMNHRFLSFASPYSSVKTWLSDFDRLEELKPVRIVPSHGMTGDASLIDDQRSVLTAIQARTTALKRDGKSADEAAQTVQSEFQTKYPDWTGPAQAGNAARAAYKEAP